MRLIERCFYAFALLFMVIVGPLVLVALGLMDLFGMNEEGKNA